MTSTQLLFIMAIVIAALIGYCISRLKLEKRAPIQAPKKSLNLSLTEIYDVIDAVTEEIITNKYEIYYKLKETTIIHKMDEEIKKITIDIIKAFSPAFLDAVRMYYNDDYFIEMITRRAQAFAIKYTQENKPKSK